MHVETDPEHVSDSDSNASEEIDIYSTMAMSKSITVLQSGKKTRKEEETISIIAVYIVNIYQLTLQDICR